VNTARVTLWPHSLLISRTGFIHPSEIRPGDEICGVARGHQVWMDNVAIDGSGKLEACHLICSESESILPLSGSLRVAGDVQKTMTLFETAFVREGGHMHPVEFKSVFPTGLKNQKEETRAALEAIGTSDAIAQLLGALGHTVSLKPPKLVIRILKSSMDRFNAAVDPALAALADADPEADWKWVESTSDLEPFHWFVIRSQFLCSLAEEMVVRGSYFNHVPKMLRGFSPEFGAKIAEGYLCAGYTGDDSDLFWTPADAIEWRNYIGLVYLTMGNKLQRLPDPKYRPRDVFLQDSQFLSTNHVESISVVGPREFVICRLDNASILISDLIFTVS